jgi:hypothetical protein
MIFEFIYHRENKILFLISKSIRYFILKRHLKEVSKEKRGASIYQHLYY